MDVETLRADATDMMEMSGAMDEMGPMTGKQKRRAEGQQIKRYEVAGLASVLRKAKYEPSSMEARAVRDAGASTDREVVELLTERLLAIEPPQETLQMLELELRVFGGNPPLVRSGVHGARHRVHSAQLARVRAARVGESRESRPGVVRPLSHSRALLLDSLGRRSSN